MRRVREAIFAILVVAPMTVTLAAIPALADGGGGDGEAKSRAARPR